MNYPTLLVHVQIGVSNQAVLQVARALAQTYHAAILGVAVAHKTQNLHEENYVFFANLIEENLPAYMARIDAAEAEFRAALQDCSDIEWRVGETFSTVMEYLAEEARGADLVIVSADQAATTPNLAPRFDLAELVALAGRPVLWVPKTPPLPVSFARGMIYWKDTVETRRAVTGALPLLQRASYVSLVRTISDDDMASAQKQMQSVIKWLNRHGVNVDPMVRDSEGDAPRQLRAVALEQKAEFAVAGAYSHSRGLRARVFGGVTRDMLHNIDRYILVSH